MNIPNKPSVLCFSGLDPTGGAGIQADIETLAALGCHTLPIVTALTVQDTRRAQRFETVSPDVIIEQVRTLLDDMPVNAIKMGMLGDVQVAKAIHAILVEHPNIPVIYDPVLTAGGGGELASEDFYDVVKTLIVPLCDLITPNTMEARKLAPDADTLDAMAMSLLSLGAQHVLITGTHAPTPEVTHHLYGQLRHLENFECARLEGEYHGSGCTLTSAIAALMAHGDNLPDAIRKALKFTLHALQHAHSAGQGQLIPNRFFWCNSK